MKDRNLCRKTESNGKKQAQSGSVWEQAEKGRANKEWKKFAVRLSAVGFCVFFLLATGCKRSEKPNPFEQGNFLRGWSEEIVPCYIVKDQTASDIFDLKTEQDWFIREEDGSYLTYQYAWFIDYYNDDVIAEIADKWTYNLEDPDWILNHTADGQTYSLAPNLVIWGFLGDPDLRYGPITYEDFVARELVYPEEQWIIGINSKGQIQHIMEGIHVQ